MSPSWKNVISRPLCQVSRSLEKLCMLQAHQGCKRPAFFCGQLFFHRVGSYLPCYDDGCDKSKTLNILTEIPKNSQTSASSLGSIQNGAWRKRQTRNVETDLVTLVRATWLSTKQSLYQGIVKWQCICQNFPSQGNFLMILRNPWGWFHLWHQWRRQAGLNTLLLLFWMAPFFLI